MALNWLVMLIRPTLTLARTTSDPGPEFCIDGIEYRAAQHGRVTATFDRLVNREGQLKGIEIWPVAAEVGNLLDEVPQFEYLRFPPGLPCFQVLFAPTSEMELQGGGEQALIGNVYRTRDGEVGISVDAGCLLDSEAEFDVVDAAHGNFVELDDLGSASR